MIRDLSKNEPEVCEGWINSGRSVIQMFTTDRQNDQGQNKMWIHEEAKQMLQKRKMIGERKWAIKEGTQLIGEELVTQ